MIASKATGLEFSELLSRHLLGPLRLHDSFFDANKPLLANGAVSLGPSRAATTFGWFSGETKSGLRVVFKDGGQPGVSTVMYLVPEENLACVAPANRSDNGEPAAQKTPMGEVAGTT